MINIKLIKKLRQETCISLDLCIEALKKNKWDIKNAMKYIKSKDNLKIEMTNLDIMENKIVISTINISKNILYIIANNNDFIIKNKLFINKLKQVKYNFINYIGNNIIKKFVFSIYKSLYLYILKKETNSVIKEQTLIKNAQILDIPKTETFYYIHNKYNNSIGKNTVFISYDNTIRNIEYKNLLIHITALNPTSIDINGLCKCILKEQELLLYIKYNAKNTARLKGQKVARNKINSLFEKVILLEQKYLFSKEIKVKSIIGTQKISNTNFISYYSYNI